MFQVDAVDAAHGDCFLVRFQDDDKVERYILIDGGPSNANGYSPYADRLMPRLDETFAALNQDTDRNNLIFELVVCTHIDTDHIQGIIELYNSMPAPPDCITSFTRFDAPALWFNSFELVQGNITPEVPREAVAVAGVGDGINLTTVARGRIGKESINSDARNGLIMRGLKKLIPDTQVQITVLAPGWPQLENLQTTWKNWIEAQNRRRAGAPAAAGDAAFRPDDSVANLSSIAMLIEGGGRRLLMCGDQRGDYILEGLRELALIKDKETFHVDLMTVPHHGSDANNLPKFHQAVTADTYVFSANGKHQNPDIATLQLIASQAATGRKFTMAFTQPDFDYARNNRGELPRFDGRDIPTLQKAIVALKTLPGVADNVTFRFRDKGANAIEFGFAPNP